MKKAIAFLLLLAAVLALTGCSAAEAPEIAGETTTAAALPTETAEELSDGNSVQDTIVAECGIPFRFNSPTNQDVYIVEFYEDHAKREVWTKYDADEEQDDIAWKIEGDQMILSGGWSESFTINLSTMEAASNRDGRVYHILEVDKVEE